MLDDILLINLFHIKDGLGDIFSLDLKIDIVSIVAGLSKLSIGYHVDVKPRDECNLF
jgi:hypothetical protein